MSLFGRKVNCPSICTDKQAEVFFHFYASFMYNMGYYEFLPEVKRICDENNLDALINSVDDGACPSNHSGRHSGQTAINAVENTKLANRLNTYSERLMFSKLHNSYLPDRLWKFGQSGSKRRLLYRRSFNSSPDLSGKRPALTITFSREILSFTSA